LEIPKYTYRSVKADKASRQQLSFKRRTKITKKYIIVLVPPPPLHVIGIRTPIYYRVKIDAGREIGK
jgi:hypothetical protein